ncbi:MAG: Gfo/Idh/MocA family oxidoreductase [Rhodobacteraceae bacterium]|nr:Gfo/Idh/MocA family oxidoreductase [Paracoccaceae bacterium]
MKRVAIIGAGIGAAHLAGYRTLSEHFEVATVCDLDLTRAEAMIGGDPAIALTDDLASVMVDPEIDILDNCLPPHLHFPVSKEALEAGKHVICEKPLVRSMAEADALADVVAATGLQVFPVFQYRYGPGLAQLRALIDAGVAGTPFVASLETHWNRGAEYYAVPWRGSWTGESGGAVFGHAIHAHDFLTSVFGPVAEVSAMLNTRVNPIETEDCAAIAFRMENGAVATSCVTLGAGDDTSRLRFCFEGLTAESGSAPYAPAEDTWRFIARAPREQEEIDAVLAEVGEVRPGFSGFLAAVSETIDGRGGQEVSFADGRCSIELVTAIYQAARNGKPVSLPLNEGDVLYAGLLPGEGFNKVKRHPTGG